MEEMSSKAINIGVALFITIIIISGVFYVINQVKTIYGQVYETNTSIQDRFSEFDQFDNTKKTGIDVLNAVKKYRNNSLVKFEGINPDSLYNEFANASEDKLIDLGKRSYTSSVYTDESSGITTITFIRKG